MKKLYSLLRFHKDFPIFFMVICFIERGGDTSSLHHPSDHSNIMLLKNSSFINHVKIQASSKAFEAPLYPMQATVKVLSLVSFQFNECKRLTVVPQLSSLQLQNLWLNPNPLHIWEVV